VTAFDVVVPVLSLCVPGGGTDYVGTRRYAGRAASTWVDYLLVNGSTAEGHLLEHSERSRLLDLWLEMVPPSRLLACCWQRKDLAAAAERDIAPMMVMRGSPRPEAARKLLRSLPDGAFVYSHPMFGGITFTSGIAAEAAGYGYLPAGGKLAKVTTDGIASIRRAAGTGFRLWDGSSRRIAESVAAGASGVVATPLCVFPNRFPSRELAAIQAAANSVQASLDALPDRLSRTRELVRRASSA
jgi:dihydrodipicolinate synthase/N-acetylneuraminate lyase